jgi:hypothetical protein
MIIHNFFPFGGPASSHSSVVPQVNKQFGNMKSSSDTTYRQFNTWGICTTQLQQWGASN